MADEFVMPKLGLTMEAGTIVRWLVADGSEVAPGQPVLVIETEKVETEVEATTTGRLHQTGLVGEEYRCGAGIGWFLVADETAPPAPSAAPTAPAAGPAPAPAVVGGAVDGSPPAAGSEVRRAATGIGGRLLASPNARRVAAAAGIDLVFVEGTGPGGRITSEDVQAAVAAGTPATAAARSPGSTAAVPAPLNAPPSPRSAGNGGEARLATAAARSLADLLGIDLAAVAPAGIDNRVSRDDVAAHVRALLARPAGADLDTPSAPLLQEPSSVVPLTGMRRTIADRMASSLRSMAQLTLTIDVGMDGVVADRERRAQRGTAPGYTDYVIAATAQALVEHPRVNSQVTADGIALLPSVHVGMAVALDDGLIVPVIRNTLALDLGALAAETTRLATAARDRTLTLEELEGGTFTVTALGMFDVDAFTPIVNAPNTAILGVGRLRDDVAWASDGSPVRTARLTLSFTWDHRAFDGAPAADFARSVKRRLESYA
ncbi:MAG: 2-oxo acid dehydrogenase subunit E2 [Acidimicrobiia bacterium]|nr:2-oxo acid dehydrogenase subunit E2 [Acidimicrobiia bacterium]